MNLNHQWHSVRDVAFLKNDRKAKKLFSQLTRILAGFEFGSAKQEAEV
jgi:hypothetical protein